MDEIQIAVWRVGHCQLNSHTIAETLFFQKLYLLLVIWKLVNNFHILSRYLVDNFDNLFRKYLIFYLIIKSIRIVHIKVVFLATIARSRTGAAGFPLWPVSLVIYCIFTRLRE